MVWSTLSCHWAAITNATVRAWFVSWVLIDVNWQSFFSDHISDMMVGQSLPFLSIHSNHGFSHILGLQNPKLPGSRFWPRPMLHSSIRSRMVLPDTPGGNWNLPAPTGNGRTRCCWSDTYAWAMIHGGLPRKRCQCLSDIGPYNMSCPRQQRARSQ